MRFSHILVEAQYETEDLLKKIREGSDFESLATKFSKCPSSRRGGDLGVVSLDRFVSEFAEAAELLSVGEISPPVRTRFGYHLIKRTE